MNIHLPAILMFTRGTRFWHTAIYLLVWMEGRKHSTQPTKSIPLGQVRYGKIMLLLQCARNYESQLFHETSFWRSACFKGFYQETSSPNFFWIPRAKPFSPRLESICRCLEAKIPLAGLPAKKYWAQDSQVHSYGRRARRLLSKGAWAPRYCLANNTSLWLIWWIWFNLKSMISYCRGPQEWEDTPTRSPFAY